MEEDKFKYGLDEDGEEEEEDEELEQGPVSDLSANGTEENGTDTLSSIPYLRNLGSLRLGKGKFNPDSLFFSWDAVPVCRELDCPIVEVCTYQKGPKVKCHIHSQFLRSLSIVLYRNFSDILDEPRLYRVGLHMMPLYKMLCKLLIEEHAVETVVYSDAKGVMRANPIFKEVRETLQSISKEWRSLGLDRLGGGGPGNFGPPVIRDPFEHGDSDFHASLESDTPRTRLRRGGGGDG